MDIPTNPWYLPADHPNAAGADSPKAFRLAFGEVWDAGFVAGSKTAGMALTERLKPKATLLATMSAEALEAGHDVEAARCMGKRQGVDLAAGFADEMARGVWAP